MESRSLIELNLRDIMERGHVANEVQSMVIGCVNDMLDKREQDLMTEMCTFLQGEVRSDIDELRKKIDAQRVYLGQLKTEIKTFERRVLEALGKPKADNLS